MQVYSLLSSRTTTPISKLNLFSNESIFIQYNIARIKSIIEKFTTHFENCATLPLVDSSLLDTDFEWNLAFVYLSQFRSLDHQLREQILNFDISDTNLDFHKILSLLYRFARLFSSYYRNVKILIKPMPEHLHQVICTRVNFCRVLLGQFERYFRILDVPMVDQM